MRRTFIAGNWKMNLDREAAVGLVRALVAELNAPEVDVAVCPPTVYLSEIAQVVADTPIGLGAQNMYHEPGGAFTGEVSAAMLRDVGCGFVILGHSERRLIMGESNADVNAKLKAALAGGLKPIVCVGETLEQREAGTTTAVVSEQFDGSFADIPPEAMAEITIAYEPVWAIGTGKVATPDQAQAVHADLRKHIANRYNAEIAEQIRIQYGGSVKPGNAAELLAQPDIDGALVGGASLAASDFLGIICPA